MAGMVLIALGVLLAIAIARDVANQLRDARHLDRMTAAGPSRGEGPEPPPGLIERRLRAAGLRISAPTYLAASSMLVVLVTVAMRSAFPALPLAAVVAAAVAAFGPWIVIKSWGRWRARRFEASLVDAVGFLVGALKAGENLTQAFSSTAEASVGVIRREFGEVAHRLRLGMPIRRSLGRVTRGYRTEGTTLFTQVLIAKRQAGGDLVPVLESVNRVLRERRGVRWRLHTHLAGARLSALLIALFPYLLIPLYLWQRPDWIDRLREHPLGPSLLLGAVALQLLGFLWMRRIMRIEL